ncbi:hypothetical protein BASA81_010989 [Batrachochytrium salamandrivorans]|nr:hypothetical protein BASA81_010989 [Batrachochytrium salamandrivorans]
MSHDHHDHGEEGSASSLLLGLAVTCVSMFLGAFAAGISCVKLDKKQLAWLNCFACGLLLGTALGVIIPEGVRSLFEHRGSGEAGEEHGREEGLVGWTLLLGFLTMMFLEDTFNSANGNGHSHAHEAELQDSVPREALARRRNTITLGLLIHNAMDGLAMGAAKSAESNVEHIVFGAIMMHHVPAAFGYATLLRSSGLEEFAVRRLMLLFSLAAPVACAVTFFVLHPDMGFGLMQVTSQTIGICLLYSGGSFLYVASVHALEDAKQGFPRWGLPQLCLLALGAIVPGVTSWGHEH